MVTPPALATGWIAGSFGSARATEDGGALEVEAAAPLEVVVVAAGEAPSPRRRSSRRRLPPRSAAQGWTVPA
jgi:hypothetical protein